MPSVSSTLDAMIRKFDRRASLDESDRDALRNLPFRVLKAEPGRYLVREGSANDQSILGNTVEDGAIGVGFDRCSFGGCRDLEFALKTMTNTSSAGDLTSESDCKPLMTKANAKYRQVEQLVL